ncbi:MAG: type II toxin-antitoxin system HicA family toxin [Bdellovibrionota bacterium]
MPLSGKELVWLLLKNGWQFSRINGSHHILKKDGIAISIPVHGSKALGKGIEQKILKQAGLKK